MYLWPAVPVHIVPPRHTAFATTLSLVAVAVVARVLDVAAQTGRLEQ